jgi:hypothetical protein
MVGVANGKSNKDNKKDACVFSGHK